MFSWSDHKKPIVALAPMAGFTDSPFRRICKEFGTDVLYSKLVSATALFYNPRDEKTLHLCAFDENERPFILQFFGREPDHFLKAIEAIEKAGIRPDGIDINMGCPVKKVIKSGYGSALMEDPKQAALIIKTLKKETKYPISIKTRSGWDSGNIANFAKEMEQAGMDAIAIHARTYKQGFLGKADWKVIKEVKEAIRIPVIGNGDIKNADDAHKMIQETGCDGVMIGRGVLGNPWIFRDIKNKSENIKKVGEIIEILIKHINLAVDFYGEEKGMKEIRKHYGFYLKGLPNIGELRRNLMMSENKNELLVPLEEFNSAHSVIDLQPKKG